MQTTQFRMADIGSTREEVIGRVEIVTATPREMQISVQHGEELTIEQYGEEELTVAEHGEEEYGEEPRGILTSAKYYGKKLLSTVLTTVKYYGEEARSYIDSKWHPYRILLIGETGSGKTSFLNLLCNIKLIEELGTNIDAAKLDQIRHYNDLKIEDSTARAMASKTSEAKFYKTELCRMRVTVIDTPGFGDSRGIEQDKENVKQIIDALKYQDYINCVCLVINGRQSRMSASLKYVLSEISAIMPKEVFDNIIVVFTNSADPLDCNFDISELDPYFGRRIERAYYIENPYCRIEKAKQKAKQLSVDWIARSLERSFVDTAETLRSLRETIKGFKDVHTRHFIRQYEKKQEIERDIILITASYDQQTKLEKEIKTAEEEVDAHLKSKSLYKDFKTTREVEVTKPVPTPDKRHNTLCGVPGCYSNCHLPCNLPKSYEPEDFKKCAAMGGRVKCKVCGHSYRYHYHNEIVFRKFKEREEFVDEAMKKKFEEENDMEQRADYLRQGLQKRREELLRKKNSLLQELNGKITEFQKLGISKQNYAKLLEKQRDVVELLIEDAVGPERTQLNALKDDLKKRLEVVISALSK